MKQAWSLFVGLVLFLSGQAQIVELPLLHSLRSDYYHQAALNQDSIHLSYASLFSNDLSSTQNTSFLLRDTTSQRNWLGRKLFEENFIILDKKNIYLTIDPIFNFSGGSDLADSSSTTLYQNTRGIKIEGLLGEKIAFSTSFLENQARFPSYINTFVENNGVVPGMGRVKDFKNQDYDYSMASASITWNATRFLRIKLGNDKDFLGFGYRSVILSDNAFNYPHLKLDFLFANNKLKYTLNYAVLQDLIRLPKGETPESLFERKMGAFHYLSYMPNRKITIGVFSGTILPKTAQESVNNYYLDAFNPIFLVNPLINNTNYINKIGLNFSWEMWKDGRLYFEVANGLKDWGELSSLIGISLWDVLPNFDVLIEYSFVGFLILDEMDMSTVYSHYSQSLAHTLGTGLSELNLQMTYHYKKVYLKGAFSLAERGIQDAQLWGFLDDDIILPPADSGSPLSYSMNTEVYYLLNPKTNMNIALGYTLRRSDYNNIFGKTDYLYLSFRTSLFNEYRDF